MAAWLLLRGAAACHTFNMEPHSDNYRVVERGPDENIGPNNMGRFGIFEALYGEEGELVFVSELPVAPTAKTVEELKFILQEYLEALEQPIVQFNDFPRPQRHLD